MRKCAVTSRKRETRPVPAKPQWVLHTRAVLEQLRALDAPVNVAHLMGCHRTRCNAPKRPRPEARRRDPRVFLAFEAARSRFPRPAGGIFPRVAAGVKPRQRCSDGNSEHLLAGSRLMPPGPLVFRGFSAPGQRCQRWTGAFTGRKCIHGAANDRLAFEGRSRAPAGGI